jgi:hypothetical protein
LEKFFREKLLPAIEEEDNENYINETDSGTVTQVRKKFEKNTSKTSTSINCFIKMLAM